MRREFKDILLNKMDNDDRIVVITADLGFGMFDVIRDKYSNVGRFINCGCAEQLMIGMATGVTMANKIPICYSISSFLLRRGFEQIKLYLNDEKFPVKLCGGGRDKDYENQGKTHWSEDDKYIMSGFPNIKPYWPNNIEDLESVVTEWLYNGLPSYLNLKR